MSIVEDLTPDQLMTIVWLAWSAVLIFSVSYLVRTILTVFISRNIKYNIEKEVLTQVVDKINAKKQFSLRSMFSDWLERRRKRKEEKPVFR